MFDFFDFFDYGATSSIEYKDVDAARLKVQEYLETKDQLNQWSSGYTMALYDYVTQVQAPSTTRFYYLVAEEAERLTKIKDNTGQLLYGVPPKYDAFQAYMLSAVDASQAALKREEDANLVSVLEKTYDKTVGDVKKAADPRTNIYALGAVVLLGALLVSRLR